jgi:hypothetical protein
MNQHVDFVKLTEKCNSLEERFEYLEAEVAKDYEVSWKVVPAASVVCVM